MIQQIVVNHQKPQPRHNVVYLVAVGIIWLAALVTYFFTIAATVVDIGIFQVASRDTGFESQLNPSGWTFGLVWFLIFSYMAVFLFYLISIVVRKSKVTEEYLYRVSGFIPLPALGLYIINLIILSAWYFISQSRNAIAYYVILVIDSLILLSIYVLIMLAIYRNYPKLNAAGFKIEDRLVVGIVLNSVGILLTWLITATNVVLPAVLHDTAEMPLEMGSAVALTVLLIQYGTYVVLDIGCLEKYFRFLYAPHLPFLLGLIGIVDGNFNPNQPLSIITVGFLIVVIAVIPTKVCLDYIREKRQPRFGDARLRHEALMTGKGTQCVIVT